MIPSVTQVAVQGTLAEKIRAAGSGIPAFYTATGVETHVQYGQLVTKYNHEGTPELYSIPKRVCLSDQVVHANICQVNIFNGKKFIQEESLGGDYAFIKAWKADTAGNLVFR